MGDNAPKRHSFGGWAQRAARWQSRSPWLVLLVAAITVIIGGALAAQLELKTSFGELLPENAESVKVAEAVNERLVSASTLTVVARGEDPEALKQLVDALAPAIRGLGSEWVGNVDDGIRASNEFFTKNALLYAPLSDVQQVRDEIVERYEYEVSKEAGFDLDLDDEAPPPISADSIKAKVEARKSKRAAEAGLPERVAAEGYYMEPDGRMVAIVVQTPVSIGDIDRGRLLKAKIDEVIRGVNPQSFHPSITVDFTGDFITGAEQYEQIKNDLKNVGLTGLLMVLGVVFLFFLRLRTLVAMAVTIAIGLVWTFGAAYIAIGHLNSSSGFLVSIVAGNGINFGIIYMARYLEARRTEEVEAALVTAHQQTWLATVAASGAAMVAYGSLIVTDFRGFKHFGIIGGIGMILCWIATYSFLPAILALSERFWPLTQKSTGLLAHVRGLYGVPFAWLVTRYPRALLAFGVVLGLGGLALTGWYIADDPMEYNLKNTRNESQRTRSPAQALAKRVDKLVGRKGQDGLAILVDRLDQVTPLKDELEKRREAAPADKKPFSRVVTVFSLLPTEQDKKIELALEARDRLERARKRDLINDHDWNEIQQYLPPKDIQPITIEDLPEQVVRSFVEKDGTRGRLVYIVPTPKRSVWDAHYLMEFADSFRSTKLPDGSVIQGSGKSVIFADLFLAVVDDAPKAIIASLIGTFLIVLLAFRGRKTAWGVMAVLLLGVVWMIAAMALLNLQTEPTLKLVGMKLNFMNFVALPISIGISADYVINIMQRYQKAGRGQIRRVIEETGGAVILCSLTTTVGYFALTFSVNLAIQSFGIAGAIGEISCVVAAVLIMPAWLAWRDGRHNRLATQTSNGEQPPTSGHVP